MIVTLPPVRYFLCPWCGLKLNYRPSKGLCPEKSCRDKQLAHSRSLESRRDETIVQAIARLMHISRNINGWMGPSMRQIVQATGIPRTSVERRVRALVRKGVLRKQYGVYGGIWLPSVIIDE